MMNEELQPPAPRPSRLGRGLAALIGDAADETMGQGRAKGQRSVPIEFIVANPLNPRKSFAEEDLTELTDSIREKGVIQPILVRPRVGVPDAYEIIAGERRWRAAQRAGLHEVPSSSSRRRTRRRLSSRSSRMCSVPISIRLRRPPATSS